MENRVRNLFLGLSALLASIILIGQAQAQSAPVGRHLVHLTDQLRLAPPQALHTCCPLPA